MHSVIRELAPLIAFPSVSSRPLTELAAHVAQREAGLRQQAAGTKAFGRRAASH